MPRVSARVRSLMTSPPPAPVPSVVDVSVDGASMSPITSPKIKTPLSALYRDSPSDSLFGSVDSERLGITKPGYEENDCDANSVNSDDSSRIGISPSKYEKPDVPQSPRDLFFQKKVQEFKREQMMYGYGTAAPHHIYFGDSDSSSNNVSALHTASVCSSAPPPPEPVNDGIKRLLHPQTANGHFLVNSSPILMPEEGIRFNLNKGVAERTPKLILSGLESTALVKKSGKTSESVASTLTTLSLSHASASVQSCSTPYKIFCLLLQPRAKIFELIHIIYSPDVTTVGDLIAMIPENATEPALGLQEYVGLCRPKSQQKDGELRNLEAMASPGDHMEKSAGIMCGEILVPIPVGFTATEMSSMSKLILKNPQIVNLLTRKNPLAPERDDCMSKSSSRMSSTIQTIMEEDYFGLSEDDDEERRERRRRRKKRRDKRARDAVMAAAHQPDIIVNDNIVANCQEATPLCQHVALPEHSMVEDKPKSRLLLFGRRRRSKRDKSIQRQEKKSTIKSLLALLKRPLCWLNKSR